MAKLRCRLRPRVLVASEIFARLAFVLHVHRFAVIGQAIPIPWIVRDRPRRQGHGPRERNVAHQEAGEEAPVSRRELPSSPMITVGKAFPA